MKKSVVSRDKFNVQFTLFLSLFLSVHEESNDVPPPPEIRVSDNRIIYITRGS